MVWSLLQRGAELNGNLDSTNALGQAVTEDSVGLVSLLFEAGADVNAYYGANDDGLDDTTALQSVA